MLKALKSQGALWMINWVAIKELGFYAGGMVGRISRLLLLNEQGNIRGLYLRETRSKKL